MCGGGAVEITAARPTHARVAEVVGGSVVTGVAAVIANPACLLHRSWCGDPVGGVAPNVPGNVGALPGGLLGGRHRDVVRDGWEKRRRPGC